MSDEFEISKVVAEYDNRAEALAAQEALQAAGIEAHLTNDDVNPLNLTLFGRLNHAPIRLAVAASRMGAALMVLAQFDEPPEEGWEDDVEGAIDGWLCGHCDTVVAEGESVCHECGSSRDDQPPVEPDEDE